MVRSKALMFSVPAVFIFLITSIVSAQGVSNTEERKPAPPAVDDAAKSDLIEQVMELSGVKKQIYLISANVNDQLLQQQQQQEGNANTEENIAFRNVMTESFQGQMLYQTVVEYLKRNFDEERITSVLEWLRSPLSQKISRLEEEASTPQAAQEITNFSEQLKSNPPSEQKLALLKQLDSVSGFTEFNVEVWLAFSRAMFRAAEMNVPSEEREPSQKQTFEKMLDEQKLKLKDSIREQVLVSNIYIYRSVSDEELKEYIGFYESEVGRWFNKTANEALLEAITKAGDTAGHKLAEK